jgi:hypothetical protein
MNRRIMLLLVRAGDFCRGRNEMGAWNHLLPAA